MKRWFSSSWPFFALLAGMAAFVALYLTSWRLTSNAPFASLEIPLFWFIDNITVHMDHNRWLDPLWAALWAIVPALLLTDREETSTVRLSPLFGLVAAGGVYLAFWGEPGALFWPIMAPVALVIGRVLHLIDGVRRSADADAPPPERYGLMSAFTFCNGFSFGVLLPHALMFGFRWAGYMFCLFVALELLVCLSVFGLLKLVRTLAWLWRKVRRQPTRNWTWKSLGVSNLVEEHEAAPDFRPVEPPEDLIKKTAEACVRQGQETTPKKTDND